MLCPNKMGNGSWMLLTGAQNGGRFVGSVASLHQRYWSFEITLTARVAPVDFTLNVQLDWEMVQWVVALLFFVTTQQLVLPATSLFTYTVYLICSSGTKTTWLRFKAPNSSHALVSRRHQLKPMQVTMSHTFRILASTSLPSHHTKRVHVMLSKSLLSPQAGG